MTLVLDTCALLYWTLGPERLSAETRGILENLDAADRAVLCSVSVWEIALKHTAGRLPLGMPLDDYVRRIHRLPLDIVAPSAWLWIDSVRLDWGHRDPADRLIVALASRRSATLVTTDQRIRDFYPHTIR